MEIYLNIDTMVKMYKNSYLSIGSSSWAYIPHETLCLCCFITVSCPINAILASVNFLVFQLLRRRQEKTRLYYFTRKKKLQKLPSFHSNPSQTFLERTKIFLPWKCQFSSKHRAMASRGREKYMSLKNLNLPRSYNRSSSKWPTDGVALTLLLA